ncbi:MAG TPA: homoserine kinase [Limnochorda sp.]
MTGEEGARVRVPATVANLGPGFDTLGLALDVFNEVELAVVGESEEPPEAGQAEVAVEGEGAEELPRDRRNRVVQAARLLWRRVRGTVPRVRARCVNRIPLRSGMGSSAAAAVAGLVAAHRLLGEPLGREELLELACELEGHGDNAAPALTGGLTVVLPQGRQVIRLDPPALDVAIALPHRRWSTQAARGVLPEAVSRQDAVFNVAGAAALVASLVSGQLEFVRDAMADRLHQPYRLRHIPGAQAAFDAGLAAGAYGVALAGAGPAVMALTPPGQGEAVAQAMARAFEAEGEGARALACRPSARGALDFEG